MQAIAASISCMQVTGTGYKSQMQVLGSRAGIQSLQSVACNDCEACASSPLSAVVTKALPYSTQLSTLHCLPVPHLAGEHIKRNLASMAPKLTQVSDSKAGHSGVDDGMLYRMGSQLFVDGSDVIPQLKAWRKSVEKRRRNELGGPPPLLINGLIKVGRD